MKSILEEFANDNLHHNSRHFKWNLAYDRAVHQIADAEKALMETLDERQRALLENFTDARDDVFLLDQTDQFVYAYRLGALMMIEVLRPGDGIAAGGENE